MLEFGKLYARWCFLGKLGSGDRMIAPFDGQDKLIAITLYNNCGLFSTKEI